MADIDIPVRTKLSKRDLLAGGEWYVDLSRETLAVQIVSSIPLKVIMLEGTEETDTTFARAFHVVRWDTFSKVGPYNKNLKITNMDSAGSAAVYVTEELPKW